MDHAAFVRRREAGTNLPRDDQRAILGEAADPSKQGREVFAVHVLHREESLAVDLIDVVHAADVGMRDLAGQSYLGVELRQARGIAIDVGGQELQRDGLAELQVVGPVHFAHAARSEPLDDAITPAKQRAGLEAAVVDRAGRGQPAAR